MDSVKPILVNLNKSKKIDPALVGGKAYRIYQLKEFGFVVPRSFGITTQAYQKFVKLTGLEKMIQTELGRKPFESMRWEEIWDAALRIRSHFLRGPFPKGLENEFKKVWLALNKKNGLAIRSSAPTEDLKNMSFAGLHESFLNVKSFKQLTESIRMVWASLWSDAALLYRKELSLDPKKSEMAVLIQEMYRGEVSGVAFGQNPMESSNSHEVIEAVPGSCENHVSGRVDPDQWIVRRSSGQIVSWRPGRRNGSSNKIPLLSKSGIKSLHKTIRNVARDFGWEPDIEWSLNYPEPTLLQVRPITKARPKKDKRSWYLSLRLKPNELKKLRQKITNEILPKLKSEGDQWVETNLEELDDMGLATLINNWHKKLAEWRRVYKKDLIPFAHGVRQFGLFYNEVMTPKDPFEFVNLLKGKELISFKRNEALGSLAQLLRVNPKLRKSCKGSIRKKGASTLHFIKTLKKELLRQHKGREFLQKFVDLLTTYMDVTFEKQRLRDHPAELLKQICELSSIRQRNPKRDRAQKSSFRSEQRRRFLKKSDKKIIQAKELLKMAELSWKLRDDDNILISRLEAQFLRALNEGFHRLKQRGIASGKEIAESGSDGIKNGLKYRKKLKIQSSQKKPKIKNEKDRERRRQLIGQPAAPGLATGLVCKVETYKDIGRFKNGNILVCDAIQPQMTHVVPLASAIIERRGGMLIHGAIIARELGRPCVNGIPDVMDVLTDGESVTVDGHLGIVSIGQPELELEIKYQHR